MASFFYGFTVTFHWYNMDKSSMKDKNYGKMRKGEANVSIKPNVGEKIEIRSNQPLPGVGLKKLFARVMNMDSEFIYISVPEHKGLSVPLDNGKEITISFFREDGIYSFLALCRKKISEDNYLVYQIAPATVPQKTQRRQYYRYHCQLSGRISSRENDKTCQIEIRDISGGGVRALAIQPYYVSESVQFEINLDHQRIVTDALVVRVIRAGPKKEYEIGIQFHNMKETDRQIILEYIDKYRKNKHRVDEQQS